MCAAQSYSVSCSWQLCRCTAHMTVSSCGVFGLSHAPTVGTGFITLQAGLLVAETEFALQVESDIAPYKGLLMGLFFMTVGMEISVGLFFAEWKTVVGGIVLLIGGKVSSQSQLQPFMPLSFPATSAPHMHRHISAHIGKGHTQMSLYCNGQEAFPNMTHFQSAAD